MLNVIILILLFSGNPCLHHAKRDARISRKEMQKSLVFVRKDAAQCRRELREFKMKLADLNSETNKKNLSK